jgi:Mrp family chromosome partitioning ATPase
MAMQPPDEGSPALALRTTEIGPCDEDVIRAVPVWASPPDPPVLVMLGEGKSTLAALLALVLSEAQRARVLLVEASLERPTLARLLGFQVPVGLGFSVQISRRMGGGTDPWAVLALGPALHVLVESETEPAYPGALYAPAFRQALDRLGRAYDWVIVDAPSVLGSGDANVVEEVVDGMIVVARSHKSRGTDLRAAMKQLGVRKAVGVVLWDAARAAGGRKP